MHTYLPGRRHRPHAIGHHARTQRRRRRHQTTTGGGRDAAAATATSDAATADPAATATAAATAAPPVRERPVLARTAGATADRPSRGCRYGTIPVVVQLLLLLWLMYGNVRRGVLRRNRHVAGIGHGRRRRLLVVLVVRRLHWRLVHQMRLLVMVLLLH